MLSMKVTILYFIVVWFVSISFLSLLFPLMSSSKDVHGSSPRSDEDLGVEVSKSELMVMRQTQVVLRWKWYQRSFLHLSRFFILIVHLCWLRLPLHPCVDNPAIIGLLGKRYLKYGTTLSFCKGKLPWWCLPYWRSWLSLCFSELLGFERPCIVWVFIIVPSPFAAFSSSLPLFVCVFLVGHATSILWSWCFRVHINSGSKMVGETTHTESKQHMQVSFIAYSFHVHNSSKEVFIGTNLRLSLHIPFFTPYCKSTS